MKYITQEPDFIVSTSLLLYGLRIYRNLMLYNQDDIIDVKLMVI